MIFGVFLDTLWVPGVDILGLYDDRTKNVRRTLCETDDMSACLDVLLPPILRDMINLKGVWFFYVEDDGKLDFSKLKLTQPPIHTSLANPSADRVVIDKFTERLNEHIENKTYGKPRE